MKEYEIDGRQFILEERFGCWQLTIIDSDGYKYQYNFKTKTKAMEEILSYSEV